MNHVDGWGFSISEIPTAPLWVQTIVGMALIASIAFLGYRLMLKHYPEDAHWHEYRGPPWKRVVYLDGSTEWGPMPCYRRRGPNGAWQYRQYDAVEMDQWNKDQAI